MIDYKTALSLIKNNHLTLPEIELLSVEALGFYLATDIYAPIDLPNFKNSAVDGFAVRAKEISVNKNLKLTQTIRAEVQKPYVLPEGSCAAIMTGAPIPDGADSVIMKEYAEIKNGEVLFHVKAKINEHIRFAGEDIKKGSLVAKKGTKVSPELLGLLLSLGISRVKIIKKPRVKIIATGDELVMAPEPLGFGQVYFSVGPMLKAQCQQLGLVDIEIDRVPDEKEALIQAFRNALDSDLILFSGGMSKGDRDLVIPVLTHEEVVPIFYQGCWRPGKPLYFGKKGAARIFGLPGNPVAAFVCFRVFVEALLDASFFAHQARDFRVAKLSHDFQKNKETTVFARAFVNRQHELSLLDAQGSHQIGALSTANALCLLKAQQDVFKAGEEIEYFAI